LLDLEVSVRGRYSDRPLPGALYLFRQEMGPIFLGPHPGQLTFLRGGENLGMGLRHSYLAAPCRSDLSQTTTAVSMNSLWFPIRLDWSAWTLALSFDTQEGYTTRDTVEM
jgi:hypothetical protein